MILVRNHQPLLNGSSAVCFFILFALLFSSCELFKPLSQTDAEQRRKKKSQEEEVTEIQSKYRFDPETGTYILIETPPTEKMDTIVWRELPPDQRVVITSDGVGFGKILDGVEVLGEGANGSKLLSSYEVALILPYLSSRFYPEAPEIDSDSEIALHFHSGALMALDILANEGVNMTVNVHDSQASESTVEKLLRTNTELKNSNLIIGPYRRVNVQQVAQYAKQNDITLVSPYSATSGLSPNNPNYIQVNPNLETHCQIITKHALARYKPEHIVLVAKNRQAEVARFEYFQREKRKNFQGTRDNNFLFSPFKEYIVPENSADFNEIDVMPYINAADTVVFIVPSWADERFVYSFLRKVDVSKKEDQVISVYGFPAWINYERIDYDYYEKLNVHVSSSSFINPLSYEVKNFKRDFFDRYGVVPSKDAYLGFDTMLFSGRMLKKYGTKFQFSFEGDSADYLHTKFDFERVVNATTTGAEFGTVEQFENKYVHILSFADYQFQRLDN